MTVTGDLAMSVGLGSSAAFCTALLRAVLSERFSSPSRELWRAAHALEGVFHGTPSGIDTGLSIWPGASLMYPQPPEIPRNQEVNLPTGAIVAGAIPRSSTTAALVEGIRVRCESDPDARDMLENLGSLSIRASRLSKAGAGGIDELGALADEAQRLLAALELSSPPLEDALQLLRDTGALGCKLSGAGGGGAFVGVYRTTMAAQEAERVLREWLGDHHPLENGPFSIVVPLG
jgi:mevalonate kinase